MSWQLSVSYTHLDYYKEGGIYKYTYGASADYNKVLRTKRTITAHFKVAFIIAFRNGEKMNVNEAIAVFKKRRKDVYKRQVLAIGTIICLGLYFAPIKIYLMPINAWERQIWSGPTSTQKEEIGRAHV